MKSFIVFFVMALVCLALGAPNVESDASLVTSRRDIDVMADTKLLIEDLVANLRKSVQEAMEAGKKFESGIRAEAGKIQEKIVEEINKLRNSVTNAVDNVMNRVSNSSLAVKECVDSHRTTAAAVFNETLSSTLVCVNERIGEVAEHLTHMQTLAAEGMSGATAALKNMKSCTAEHTNLLAAGVCLGSVAVKTQIQAVGILSKLAFVTSEMSVGFSALPVSLEYCAGMRLVQAGIQTGKVVIEIGTCSASGVYQTIIGNHA